jgi:hypothetical protein
VCYSQGWHCRVRLESSNRKHPLKFTQRVFITWNKKH